MAGVSKTRFMGHLCGGSVIGQRWILTAAHCFDKFSPVDVTIIAGEHHLRTPDSFEQEVAIERFFRHPRYNVTCRYNYDLALLKLNRTLEYNNRVGPVCLPDSVFPSGLNCSVTGWGTTQDSPQTPSQVRSSTKPRKIKNIGRVRKRQENIYGVDTNVSAVYPLNRQILKEARLPLVSHDTCRKSLNDLRRFGFCVTKRMRCAGYASGGVDACRGDSGGPLVCHRNRKWYLMGVVSWGDECGSVGRYGVYADVWRLKRWIQETIQDA